MRMSGSALRSCGWPAPAAVIWTRCCLHTLLFGHIVVWTHCCLDTDRPCDPQLRLTSLSALLPW